MPFPSGLGISSTDSRFVIKINIGQKLLSSNENVNKLNEKFYWIYLQVAPLELCFADFFFSINSASRWD